MLVHIVFLNPVDCEAVTLAGHELEMLREDVEQYFLKAFRCTLDGFESCKDDVFRITSVDFGPNVVRQEIATRQVTVEELRAFLTA